MFCTNCGKEIPDSSQFCEYCGKSTQSKLQSTKKIQVTIQRRKKFTGCAIQMSVFIDNQKVAKLKNGESTQIEVPAGKHQVIVEFWNGVSKTEVDFSEKYSKMYLEIGIKMGLVTSKAVITQIKGE
jgi:predicted nucleic acid-binding Zn ribbon protein